MGPVIASFSSEISYCT